jgi:tryptophanase
VDNKAVHPAVHPDIPVHNSTPLTTRRRQRSLSMPFHTIIEPFRIKTVEPIRRTTRQERDAALQAAHYNLFLLKAEDVLIDLLTDSGTGAMSSAQWAGMMQGDESYAGARSYFRFESAVKEITNLKHVIPTHQGRAAERILFGSALKTGDIVPNNTHFDTTRANVEYRGATALDIPIPIAREPERYHPFKGNIDLDRLEQVLQENPGRVPLVMITVTNNSGGGQPVSMANIRAASELCHRYHVPLFLDACRFAENAWFIKMREEGYADKTPLAIAQEMFSYVDGCTMSAKKDGLANIGGFLALNDDELAQKCKNLLILTEGFPTYGGLAGYDLEAIAVGLHEVLDEDYLNYRIRSVEYLGEELVRDGIPIVNPPGGHAIYVDARAMLPHIPQSEYPAWALSLVLYLEGGIRSVEIGSVMFGLQPDGTEKPATMELVRLAFPRRVYTQSHVDYLVEVMLHVNSLRERIRGVRIVEAPPTLRHFSAKMAPAHGKLIVDAS